MDEGQAPVSAHSALPTNGDKSLGHRPLSTQRLMQLMEPSTMFGMMLFE